MAGKGPVVALDPGSQLAQVQVVHLLDQADCDTVNRLAEVYARQMPGLPWPAARVLQVLVLMAMEAEVKRLGLEPKQVREVAA